MTAVELRDVISVSAVQKKWNEDHPYRGPTYLNVARRLLDKVRAENSFTVLEEEIQTTGDFPSTYRLLALRILGPIKQTHLLRSPALLGIGGATLPLSY